MEGKNGLMTHGNIAKQLIVFAIPLLVGNLFQQLYNTVDSIVVGNFIGDQALAAVNSSGPIIDMLGNAETARIPVFVLKLGQFSCQH